MTNDSFIDRKNCTGNSRFVCNWDADKLTKPYEKIALRNIVRLIFFCKSAPSITHSLKQSLESVIALETHAKCRTVQFVCAIIDVLQMNNADDRIILCKQKFAFIPLQQKEVIRAQQRHRINTVQTARNSRPSSIQTSNQSRIQVGLELLQKYRVRVVFGLEKSDLRAL